MNQQQKIRAFYKHIDFLIRKAGRNEWADDDAYLWEYVGGIVLTPIERWLWSDIRQVDAVLYPQYPVGPFFVDFGNPLARVAIECDGQAFHTDHDKDAAREKRIGELGWTVYRISGSDCRKNFDEETMTPSPAYQLVRYVAELHDIRRK